MILLETPVRPTPDLTDLKTLRAEESSLSGSDMEEEDLSYHTNDEQEGDEDDDSDDEEDQTIENTIRHMLLLPTIGWQNFQNINFPAILNNNLNSFNQNLRNTGLWKIYEHSLENFSKTTIFKIGRGNSETYLLEDYPNSVDDIFISSRKGIKDPEEKFYHLLRTKDSDGDLLETTATNIENEAKTIDFDSDEEDGEDDAVVLSEDYWTSLVSATTDGTDSQCITKAPICPFFHRLSYSVYDIIKISIGTVILAPLRFVAMFILICLAWFLGVIATSFMSLDELLANPLPAWRRAIRWFLANFVMRAFYFCCGFHWIVKKGKQATPAEAPILVAAPHSSFFDVLPFVQMGAPSIVAKSETRNVPFFGKLVDLVQPVYVSRENQKSRQSTVKTIADRVERIKNNENWPQIYIYPEGTCNNTSCLITFKCGAFLPGVPVQPVLIKYPNRFDHLSWTFDGPGAAKILWLTLSQFTNYCELEYLPVYTPSEEEKKDANLYAANVRQVMAEAMGVPTVDYTFEDGMAMNELNVEKIVKKLKGISTLRKTLDISPVEEISIMRTITSDGANDWLATKERFIRDFSPSNPDSALLDELFTYFEQTTPGMIDMREYLVHACLLNPCLRVDQIVPPFFLMYTHGRKRMSLDGFSQFIFSIFQLTDENAVKSFNSGSPQDTMDLEKFTKTTKKRLEYLKLLGLEVINLLSAYPPRKEINSGKHSSLAKCKAD